jgi:hypothetical protein
MVGATCPIFVIVDHGPAHRAKKTRRSLQASLAPIFHPMSRRNARTEKTAEKAVRILVLLARIDPTMADIGSGRKISPQLVA